MEEEKVTSGYFQLIYDHLKTIEESLDPIKTTEEALDKLSISSEDEDAWTDHGLDQLKLLKMDFVSLKMFCLCLETWDFTTDEESMERLKSIITSLKVIWLKEDRGLSSLKRLADSRSIQDFNSAKLDLETKIQQSKQQVEGWCDNLIHSSTQCKSSTFSETQGFIQHLQKNLTKISKYRSAETVPLMKQIDFVIDKRLFLDELLSNVESCPHSNEILQFLNFVCSFATSLACLTCLYWAKEANDETAIEMNIVLFDMMRKFIPCSYGITSLYTGILKSYNLQPSGTFLFGEVAEKFVDFFFERLATTLKDDFPVIRDRLIFLFTFLADPPCENAEEENLIRSQIHALLHEDAYLFLPFHDMEEDLCNEKRLLSDCKIKIDTTIAKIRQLYCGFSDSWIRLEVEKMEYNYFVSVDRELSWIDKFSPWDDEPEKGQVQLYSKQLQFLRMFLLCFATQDDTDEEMRIRLSSRITSFQGIWEEKEEKRLLAHRLYAIREGDVTDWHPLAYELKIKIGLSKLAINIARWVDLFNGSTFRCKPTTSYKTLKFMDSILENLNRLEVDEIGPFKKQIETIKERLEFLNGFLRLASNCSIYISKELEEFKMLVQIFANAAACLTFVYWDDDESDQSAAVETYSMLSDTLQKIKPVTPDVARLYFGILMAIYAQRSDTRMFGKIALNFVDLFLEDPVTPLKDDFQILRDDIVFLLIFLNNPPNVNEAESICRQIDVHFWEGLYGLFPFNDMEVDFSKKKVLLNDFKMKIQSINANIRQIYDVCSCR